MADDRDGDRTEEQEQQRLEDVHPDRSAHATEEDVGGHDQRHHRAAQRVGHKPVADVSQHPSAAHDADNHVGHQHHHTQRKDDRADGGALPAVSEKRHLRLVPKALADGPEPRADEEDRQGDDEARR